MNSEIKPMEREEMLRRLKAGEHPIDVSIDKWNRVKELWEALEAGKDVPQPDVYGDTCALCEASRVAGCVSCPKCILYEMGDHCLACDISSWVLAKNSKNAEVMVRALERAKTVLQKRGDYEKYLEEHKEKPQKRYVGQIYTRGTDSYILAYVGNDKVGLLNRNYGSRWSEPIEVCDSSDISQREWNEIIGSASDGDFVLLTSDKYEKIHEYEIKVVRDKSSTCDDDEDEDDN